MPGELVQLVAPVSTVLGLGKGDALSAVGGRYLKNILSEALSRMVPDLVASILHSVTFLIPSPFLQCFSQGG